MSEQRTGPTELAQRFESERPYLRAVAARMLGSAEDAEDAVQETWLRLDRSGGEGIDNLRAWLTTVVSRVCLDMLRARHHRREVAVEIDLEELTAGGSGSGTVSPEEEILLDEAVGLALHVVMGALTPAERVAFVLHDIFELPFEQVAAVLGRSTGAVKMLASRGRRRIRVVPAPEGDAGRGDRSVVDAFFEAAGSGEPSALLALLAPDAELHVVTGRRVTVLRGAAGISSQVQAGARSGLGSRAVLRPVVVNGAAGTLVLVDGRPISVIAFTVRDGLISQLRSFADRRRLAQVVPSWVS